MALLYRMGTGNGSGGDLKPYIVQFTCDSGYIGQTLTMTYKGIPHAGEVVEDVSGTVVLDSTDGKGKLTLYPMHSGNWECSCYSSVTGTTMKKTIELLYWGTTNVEFNDKPNGATVTPTDNVQTWLHCANIWDKTDLTTIDDVIADTTTLNILISDNNASDYLARSTTWTNNICSNESAMTYIGLNDYCANKLLGDSTWLKAICNSTHFEKVLTVKIPTMTSNTSPSGEAFGSPYYNNMSEYTWYKAMDKNNNTCWHASVGLSTAQLGYDFGKQVIVKKILLKNRNDSSTTSAPKTFSLEGYNGTSYVKIQDFTNNNNNLGAETTYIVNNNDEPYSKYRLNITSSYSSVYALGELQFYGREEA